MPRENSFSDSDGRSLTPDLEEVIFQEEQRSSPKPSDAGRPQFPEIDIASAPAVLLQGTTLKSPVRPDMEDITRSAYTTPGDRFRAAVRKVITMHRTTSSMMLLRSGIGAEPGVDPRRASANQRYGNIKQRCVIEVVDYSTMRTSFGRMTNHEFVEMFRNPDASRRDPWVRVRWINVAGISWDVVSALALKYDIHPLALEDVLSQRRHSRSKVDYYPQHLFLRILCHSLAENDKVSPMASLTDLPRSESPEPYGTDDSEDESDSFVSSRKRELAEALDDATEYGSASSSRFSTKRGLLTHRFSSARRRKDVEKYPLQDRMPQDARFSVAMSSDDKRRIAARDLKLIKELKKGDRVNVQIHPVCIFLFRDGTVLSINRDTNIDFTAPITQRLRQRHTGLRTTADPSLLVQSLLDLMVDSALEVVEEYQGKFLKIEQEVLLKPSMKTYADESSKIVHILQGDLILHRRTLEPIKTVIYGLRRYDDDRAAALSEKVNTKTRIEGYMSHKAKIYLADVHDHMDWILTSLDMFAGVSENLINYTFNVSAL
ncbi:uncharacterized protein FIBRA_00054 [Fibroporia radiculosa]|uniref:Uncharacterized protein n=1 Tax=Fibroporia radiculosa TaxID=599839 RepID=J7RUR5_9APHY|nr:uncharacterized protein FIBRA_00054 [Fibroporia radiculosa]CCL98060.1 predicted protein [Fibroporia radiculosa]